MPDEEIPFPGRKSALTGMPPDEVKKFVRHGSVLRIGCGAENAERGFTLVEALAAAVIVGLGVIAGYVFLGRKIVDDGDAVKAAAAAGFIDAKVTARHNFLARFHGCGAGDDLAFDLKAKDAGGKDAGVKVCCGAWFKGCAVPVKGGSISGGKGK